MGNLPVVQDGVEIMRQL